MMARPGQVAGVPTTHMRHTPVPRPRAACSLLLASILCAITVRAWLAVYTNGVIDGDEALLGIQAENILRGAQPMYFYGQAYMGTLEAHLVALVFWLAGPSVWTLRAEPILLSVVLVLLTWKLAHALADFASVPEPARTWFVTIASFIAALPPLYDLVIEMRTLGGYIETFILTLWLLLSAVRLTERWRDASTRELLARWAGIGFLAGLGMWVDPLIVMALLAVALWIGGYLTWHLANEYRQLLAPGDDHRRRSVFQSLKEVYSALVALPAAAVGFAPGIWWGIHNHWENVRYLLVSGVGSSGSRVLTVAEVTVLYGGCTVPRIVGGALPTSPGVTPRDPHVLTPMLIVGGGCLLIAIMLFGVSFVSRHPNPILKSARRLAALPLLFAGCSGLIFCLSRISTLILVTGCGAVDLVGRYATPLLTVLPFLLATVPTLFILYIARRAERHGSTAPKRQLSGVAVLWNRGSRTVMVGLVAVLLVYGAIEGSTYLKASSNETMQTSGCTIAPATEAPIIAYMKREHIHYAWASGWVGNVITFSTNGSIIVVDPRWASDRIPVYTAAVLHANRPSVLLLAPHGDVHPNLLQVLDNEKITYRIARFSSEPGTDLLVITPLNRSVSPTDGNDLGVGFGGC